MRGLRLGAMLLILLASAACTAVPSDSTQTLNPSSTTELVSSTTGVTVTTSEEPATAPFFPEQQPLPVQVFVDGAIYNLAQVPPTQLVTSDEPSFPMAGPPLKIDGNLLEATGQSYDADLILFTNTAAPRVLANHVGSFAVNRAGDRLAWAEPETSTTEGNTRLVQAAFPSGEGLDT
ncbi:MAG: hypothetical protein WB239_04510, partial [Acidimicrobiia bacterium]